MKPRRIITTAGTAIAVGLLLVAGPRLTADAEHHPLPPEGERPPAAVAGADDSVGLDSDAGPPREGRRDLRGREGEGDAERRDEKDGKKGKYGRGHRGSDGPKLTEAQVEEAVALMIELDPSIAPRIEQLRAERPELLRHAISRRFPRMGYMLQLKERQPAFYALRVSDIRLENLSLQQARALAALPADDAGVEAARAALRTTLAEHFAVRQNVRRVELTALREKLAEMETKLGDDEGRREALIQQRLEQLEAEPPPPANVRGQGNPDRRGGRRGDGGRQEGPGGDGSRSDGSRSDSLLGDWFDVDPELQAGCSDRLWTLPGAGGALGVCPEDPTLIF